MKTKILIGFGIVCCYASASFADKNTVLIYPRTNTTCPEYTQSETKNCDADAMHERDKTCRTAKAMTKNKIVWKWSPTSGVSVPFKIVMKIGNERPFKDQRKCTGTLSQVTCHIKKSTGRPDGRVYHYAVAVADDCKLDPRIIIF